MATLTDPGMTTQPYKIVGKRPIRHDGVDKVTGKAIYGADWSMARLFAVPTLMLG